MVLEDFLSRMTTVLTIFSSFYSSVRSILLFHSRFYHISHICFSFSICVCFSRLNTLIPKALMKLFVPGWVVFQGGILDCIQYISPQSLQEHYNTLILEAYGIDSIQSQNSTWKSTQIATSSPLYGTTPESVSFIPLQQTPRSIRQLVATGVELISYPNLPEDLQDSLLKFTRGGVAVVRCGLLMKQRLKATVQAENARKSRKQEVNKVFQKKRVFDLGNARYSAGGYICEADIQALQEQLDRGRIQIGFD